MAKYSYSTNGSTDLYALTATASTADSIQLTGLSNPATPTTYTFRLWGVDTTCFNDTTIVLNPSVCPVPCNVSAPSVTTPRQNVCPATTVDLTAISAALTPSVSGGVFEWHVSNSSGSAIVSNQTAVGNGTYYLFEKAPAGCYSTGTAVQVQIQSCCTPNRYLKFYIYL